jgi:mycothiol S-conjugate amidase
MKKILFAVFAHPDDESFGPSGTLLAETQSGTELHLILLTNGDGGSNPDHLDNLGEVRLQEWRQAGALMGARGMHYLGYNDGYLNNQTMSEISQRIMTLITSTVADTGADTSIELLTNDLNGITGHIDHIVAARAACFAFYTLKQQDERFERIRLACLNRQAVPTDNINWIYMEAGRPAADIHETVDNRQLRDEIIAIIRTHHSQRQDGEYCITSRGDELGIDHFIVKT